MKNHTTFRNPLMTLGDYPINTKGDPDGGFCWTADNKWGGRTPEASGGAEYLLWYESEKDRIVSYKSSVSCSFFVTNNKFKERWKEMRKVKIILNDGTTTDFEFEGNLIDCMQLYKEKFGYYPFIDSEYNSVNIEEMVRDLTWLYTLY